MKSMPDFIVMKCGSQLKIKKVNIVIFLMFLSAHLFNAQALRQRLKINKTSQFRKLIKLEYDSPTGSRNRLSSEGFGFKPIFSLLVCKNAR